MGKSSRVRAQLSDDVRCKRAREEDRAKASLANMAEKEPPKGRNRKRKTVFERATAKRLADAERSRTVVTLGPAFERWRQLKVQKGLRTDAMVALFLLDSYGFHVDSSTITPKQGECKKTTCPSPAPPKTVHQTSSDRIAEIEVTIDANDCSGVESRPNTENMATIKEEADSCGEEAYVPMLSQRDIKSEPLLECEKEELGTKEEQTLHVQLKLEEDAQELSIDQTECKPEPSLLPISDIAQSPEMHHVSNNPVSLSTVQSPVAFAPLNQLQSQQPSLQILPVQFALPGFTVLTVQPPGHLTNNNIVNQGNTLNN